MDVMNPEQAKIAERAGACAVMALEKIPADIRAEAGVARMSDPKMIKEIQQAVSIPVMAKVRIGHFVEAQILEALDIDYIDESEVIHCSSAAFKGLASTTFSELRWNLDEFTYKVGFRYMSDEQNPHFPVGAVS